jgi:hypothetical protein
VFLYSFAGGFFGLLAFSFWLIPDWIPQWLVLLRRYPGYVGNKLPISPLFTGLTSAGQILLYVFLGIVCAGVIVWCLLRWWKGRLSFFAVLATCGLIAYLFIPQVRRMNR